MRLALIITAILEVTCFSAFGQTSVNGTLTQDTHWTLAGSPYTLTGTVGIISGVTLTIDAGVQVNGSYDLLIKGNLSINGTTGAHVTIQSTRIIFKNTDLGLSSVTYVDFAQGGVQLADESEFIQDSPKNSGTLTLSNCIFNNNSYARSKGYITNAKLVLNSCGFNSSIIYGYYPRSEMIEVNNSTLSNSSLTSDSYNYGIKISSSIISNSNLNIGCCAANFDISTSQITGGSISDFNTGGTFKLDQSTVTNCGFSLGGTEVFISNSNISSLQLIPYLITMRTGGITNSTITGNNNLNLVKVAGDQWSSFDFENVTFNQFSTAIEIDDFSSLTLTSCNFINANQYTVRNLSSKNINAQQSYWGTTDEQTIKNQIFDLYDDINYGIVDYSNYLQAPVITNPVSAPSNLFKGLATQGVFLRWTVPNDSKVIGYKVYKKSGPSSYLKVGDAGNSNSYYTSALTLQDEIVITSYTSFADGVNDVLEGNESTYSGAANLFFQSNVTASTLCSKDTLKVSLTKNFAFLSDKYFVLQLAGIDGSFNKPYLLDSLKGAASSFKWVIPDTIKSQKKYTIRVLSRQLSIFTQDDSVKASSSSRADFNYHIQKCPAGSVSFNYTKDQNATASWNYDGGVRANNNVDNPFVVTWVSTGEKSVSLRIALNGCTSQVTKKIKVEIPVPLSPPSICEVTLDSTTLKNRIIWNYSKTNTLKFGIYKEGDIANNFESIGSVASGDQNSFIDLLSVPDQQAYKYRLSAFDSCGVETIMGNPHKTIHLQISSGGINKWNLDWNEYEGLSVTSYKIYRGSSLEELSLLSSVAGDVNSFTDLNPLQGGVYYQVRVSEASCGIAGSTSNLAFDGVTGLENTLAASINIYPNPVKNVLVIQSLKDDQEKNFEVTDILGRQVQKGSVSSEYSLSMDNFESGIYFVKVQAGFQYVVKKVIKE